MNIVSFSLYLILILAVSERYSYAATSDHGVNSTNINEEETDNANQRKAVDETTTFDGIPIKQWIKEFYMNYTSSGRSLSNIHRKRLHDDDNHNNPVMPSNRGDIQVLKDYYAKGSMKRHLNSTSSSNTKNGVFDVIIVGAGWAGISAAMTLESKGITNYKILEARDYIGGRSRTITVAFNGEEIPVDIGSMWIHGGVDNPLFDIVTTVGSIPTFECEFTEQLYKPNNAGPFTDQEYTNYYRNLFENGFMDFQAERQESTDKDEALQVSANMYTNKLPSNVQKDVLKRMMTNYIELEYSAQMDEMSLWWWDMDAFVGSSNDLFLPEGYSPLIEAYAAPVTDKVKLGCAVNQIDYRKNIVTVRYTNSGSQAILRSKKVIVTVPLGVLKANTINFKPKLPFTRRRSIEKLGMGHMNKIFMFWNPNDTFWPSDTELFSDIVQSGTDFQFFNAGVYNGGKPMLFAFYSGSEIETMEDQPDYKEKVTARAMIVLRNMFGNDIKDPEKVIVTDWNQDEFSYGTYSFNKLGAGRNFRQTLGRPIRNKRLYIAGEATHFRYFQTTHGAYLSGINTANKVANSL